MKALSVLSVVLGVVAVALGVYGLVETLPNFEGATEMMMDGKSRAEPELMAWRDELSETLTRQTFAAWGAGGVGLVLGVIAAGKGKVGLGWLGAALGVVGAVLGALLIH